MITKPRKLTSRVRTGGAGVGNILLAGVIGAGVDASNGSMNSLYPRPLYVKLAATGSTNEVAILDKKDEVIATVAAPNAKVMADVEKGLAEQQEKARKVGRQIELRQLIFNPISSPECACHISGIFFTLPNRYIWLAGRVDVA